MLNVVNVVWRHCACRQVVSDDIVKCRLATFEVDMGNVYTCRQCRLAKSCQNVSDYIVNDGMATLEVIGKNKMSPMSPGDL